MPVSCLLSAIKNEGPDLLEWAVYHHLIGFDHLLVYSNDCTDGSDDLLDAIASLGWLTHRRHTPPAGVSPQDAVAAHLMTDPVVQGCDWAMWLDADEFLVIHQGQKRLPDLIAAAAGAEAVALNWRVFGDNGHDLTDDSLVTERFVLGMPLDNKESRSVKTLFKLGPHLAEFDIHRPVFVQGSGATMLDGSGKAHRNGFAYGRNRFNRPKHRAPDGRQSWKLGQINHYPIKALDRYLLKRLRGNGQEVDLDPKRFDHSYLDMFNYNEVEDHAIGADLPALKAAIAAALTHEPVARAFAACQAADAARRAAVVPMIAALAPVRYRRSAPPTDDE